MGGRVSDIAIDPRNPAIFFVGLSTGGLFKTGDNGVTFDAVFDKQPVQSIGAVAIAPSDLPSTNYYAITPDYFRVLQTPLLRGRFFSEQEVREQRHVVAARDRSPGGGGLGLWDCHDG